jgi:hypothetical protein
MLLLLNSQPQNVQRESYFNGLLFVIMASTGGRLDNSSIRILFNTLMGFTLTYPDQENCPMPFIKILVTNFSRKYAYDEGSDNEMGTIFFFPKKKENSFEGSDQSGANSTNAINAENFISELKGLLVKKIVEVQRLDEAKAAKLVDSILPDTNFYFFKEDFSENAKKESELGEIKLLVKDILASPPMGIASIEYMKPVIITEVDIIQSIMRLYEARLGMLEKIVSDYQQRFQRHFK